MSKRKDEDGVDGDVFSRRTASEWVLLFDAKPGKLDVQGTSKISYVCPALAGCQLGRAKDRHSFRCGSDDNDIAIRAIPAIVSKHADCVRDLTTPHDKAQQDPSAWLRQFGQASSKKAKLQQEEAALSAQEQLAQIELDRAEWRKKQSVPIDENNHTDFTTEKQKAGSSTYRSQLSRILHDKGERSVTAVLRGFAAGASHTHTRAHASAHMHHKREHSEAVLDLGRCRHILWNWCDVLRALHAAAHRQSSKGVLR